MIMIIRPEEALGTSFSPVAEITEPVRFFKNRGLEFARDEDDLDAYEYAAFMVEGRGMMVLQHYIGAAEDTVSLLLADNFEGLSDLGETLGMISQGLGVPAAAFHWRQNGEDVSLAAARAKAA